MNIYFNKILSNKIILLSGNHTSGKSLMNIYLNCFSGLEVVHKEPLIGSISSLYYSKQINENTSKFLLNFIINNSIRYNQIGRKLNTKISDETSIFNHSNPEIYLKRIFNVKNKSKNNFHIFDTHNVILSFKLWKKTLKNFSVIHLERHPIDIVESCYRRKNFLINKNYHEILSFEKNQKLIPFYLFNINKNNDSLINTTIDIIYKIFIQNLLFIKKYKKNNLIVINFEKLKSNPIIQLSKIKKKFKLRFNNLLKNKILEETKNIEEIKKKREISFQKISKICSKKHLLKLIKIGKIYDDQIG